MDTLESQLGDALAFSEIYDRIARGLLSNLFYAYDRGVIDDWGLHEILGVSIGTARVWGKEFKLNGNLPSLHDLPTWAGKTNAT